MTPSKPPEVLHKIVPIERVEEDPNIQVRAGGLDPAVVAEYSAIIEAVGEMDPLDLFYESLEQPKYLLAEGHHRLAAYRAKGIEKVKCRLRQGTRSDALEFAAYRNARHGVRLTNADKRRAAQLAVEDPVLGELTDTEIAKRICVSASLVSEVRRGRTPESRRAAVPAASPSPQPPVAEPAATTPAPQHKQKKAERTKVSKAAALKQIQSWIDEEEITDDDLCELMETKKARPFAVAKPGEIYKLRIVDKRGRDQVFVPVVAKDWAPDVVTAKFEDGKLVVE